MNISNIQLKGKQREGIMSTVKKKKDITKANRPIDSSLDKYANTLSNLFTRQKCFKGLFETTKIEGK